MTSKLNLLTLKRTLFFINHLNRRNGLVIVPSLIKIDKKNKTFQITGKINGGWVSVIPFEFEIYIGHRTDTISNITLSPNFSRKRLF